MKQLILTAITLLSLTTVNSQDWQTDEVVGYSYSNAIKYELLKHLTPCGQAVVRMTNLQSCKTDILAWIYDAGEIKSFEAGETDTMCLSITSGDGYGLVAAVPYTDCDGTAYLERLSFPFDASLLLPASTPCPSKIPITNIHVRTHSPSKMVTWLTHLGVIVRLGVPNNVKVRDANYFLK